MTPDQLAKSCGSILESLQISRDFWTNLKSHKNIIADISDLIKAVEKYKQTLSKSPQKAPPLVQDINKKTATLLKHIKAADQQIRTAAPDSSDTTLGALSGKAGKTLFANALADTLGSIKQLNILLKEKINAPDGAPQGPIELFHESRQLLLHSLDDDIQDIDSSFTVYGPRLDEILASALFPDSMLKDIKDCQDLPSLNKYFNNTVKPDQAEYTDLVKDLADITADFNSLKPIEEYAKNLLNAEKTNAAAPAQIEALTPDETARKQIKQLDAKTAGAIDKSCAKLRKLLARLKTVPANLQKARDLLQAAAKARPAVINAIREQTALIKSGALQTDSTKELKQLAQEAARESKDAAAQLKKIESTIAFDLERFDEAAAQIIAMTATLKTQIAKTLKAGALVTPAQIATALASKDPGDALDTLIEELAARRKTIEKIRLSKLSGEDQFQMATLANGKVQKDILATTALLSADLITTAKSKITVKDIKALIDARTAKFETASAGFLQAVKMLNANIAAEDEAIKKSMKLLGEAQKKAKNKR